MKVLEEVRHYMEDGAQATPEARHIARERFLQDARVRGGRPADVLELASPKPRVARRRNWQVATLVACVSLVAAPAISLSVSEKGTQPQKTAVPASTAHPAVKALLLSALDANAGDILEDVESFVQAGTP